ncbi:hypothetical protein [Amycolatopsis rifamycinica]|uniref:hypothetical protein n=1 Tax=Amycolatopsis rifamycinica TaxID=287986 RepID=UPI001F492367|nr:hypothetical protein [Amycolatopsis rifamycinica]
MGDFAGGHSVFACRRVLSRDGRFAAVGGPAGRWVQPAGHAEGKVVVTLGVPGRSA